MSKNEEKLIGVLQSVGLTELESMVYFAALSLGPSAVLALARASGVKRTTIYSLIESLKGKGLMAEEARGLKTVFVAIHPDKLKVVMDERKKLLDKHLNELTTLYNLNSEQGTLRYYEGLPAVQSVYETILDEIRPHDYYLVIANVERWRALDPKYFDAFVERRAKKNIDMRLMFIDSEQARHAKQFEKNFNQQVKILPAGTTFSTSLIITPQRIVIHQHDLPISAIVIQTKSAIQLQKELFEILWRDA